MREGSDEDAPACGWTLDLAASCDAARDVGVDIVIENSRARPGSVEYRGEAPGLRGPPTRP